MLAHLALAAVAIATLSPDASAQVYRCTIDGKTTYSGTPCAADAERINASPAAGPGSHDDALRARIRTMQDERAIRNIEQQRNAAKVSRSLSPGGIGGAEKSERCNDIARERASAEYWSQEFVHPDNIKREKRKAEHYAQRDFFECAPSNMR